MYSVTYHLCSRQQPFFFSFSYFLFIPESTAESADPSKDPRKKKQKQKGSGREAASQRLLAAAQKIAHVFTSGLAGCINSSFTKYRSHHSNFLRTFNTCSVFLCSIQSVYNPVQGFFKDVLHAEYRAATDVYALMFLTDVIDFIIIIFGFWAFGVSDVDELLDGSFPSVIINHLITN